jgi:hypothetical protein
MNPGATSSISISEGHDWYWAVWCDRLEIENQPNEVWGAWGNLY